MQMLLDYELDFGYDYPLSLTMNSYGEGYLCDGDAILFTFRHAYELEEFLEQDYWAY